MKRNYLWVFKVIAIAVFITFSCTIVSAAEKTLPSKKAKISSIKYLQAFPAKEEEMSSPQFVLRTLYKFHNVETHSMNCSYVSCPPIPEGGWPQGIIGHSAESEDITPRGDGLLTRIGFCIKCDMNPPPPADAHPSVSIDLTDHGSLYDCPTFSHGVWDKPKVFPAACYKPVSIGYYRPPWDRKSLYIHVVVKQYDSGWSSIPCNEPSCGGSAVWEKENITIWVLHNYDVKAGSMEQSEGLQCIEIPQR